MLNNCVMCAIVAGEIPSHKVYEDENFLAFLDIYPANPGHTLIIPKRHTPDIFGLTKQEAAGLMPLAQRLAEKIRKTLNPAGINILQNNGKVAGQVIFHYHLHIIPRHEGDNVIKLSSNAGEVSSEELAKMAEKLTGNTA